MTLVIVSWLALWLDPASRFTARLIVAVSSLLSLMALAEYVSSLLPPVGYTKVGKRDWSHKIMV